MDVSQDPPLRIQYLSDIHLEHMRILNAEQLNPEQWVTPDPTADVLVLAGDIGWPDKPAYGLFLQWCSEHWPQVVVVAGNHEFYTTGGARIGPAGAATGGIPILTRYEKMNLIRLISRSLPNVHYLQEGKLEIRPGVWILGCTLWSEIPEDMRKYAVTSLNDFRQIYGSETGGTGTTFT
jgi:predicted MPP superfamily phosphohydrolase